MNIEKIEISVITKKNEIEVNLNNFVFKYYYKSENSNRLAMLLAEAYQLPFPQTHLTLAEVHISSFSRNGSSASRHQNIGCL